MGRGIHHRFRKVGSITPLYRDDSEQFYWNHCWYCGVELIHNKKLVVLPANGFTRDHVFPESKGGGKGANTVPACKECNSKKGALRLEEWRTKKFEGKGGKFYGEQREEELKAKLDRGEIKASLRAQLAMAIGYKSPEYRPPPVRCMFYREQFVTSPLATILRRLFHANLG